MGLYIGNSAIFAHVEKEYEILRRESDHRKDSIGHKMIEAPNQKLPLTAAGMGYEGIDRPFYKKGDGLESKGVRG